MNAENYIPNARTPEEHFNNVQFQATNVKGWLSSSCRENAHIKAECLLRDAELLVAAFEAEARSNPLAPALSPSVGEEALQPATIKEAA